MLMRAILKTGEAIPALGLGTWNAFDVGAQMRDRAGPKGVLDLFFAAGGRVIDSSPMYGKAETVVGDLLDATGQRGAAWIATKVWTTGKAAGIEQMRSSARKLRKPALDLIQVHNLVDCETHLDTLAGWKKEGAVRYVGITHYTTGALNALADIVARRDIDFVQTVYSIGTREAERRLLPLCADRGVAVIANKPFDTGALFRRARGRKLPPVAKALGCQSWAAFFLKFILGHPAITVAIPASGDPDHARDWVDAGAGPIPDEAMRRTMAAAWDAL
ncbi:MAG: aldo/keto reductase [Alphaproteobacteria bacterium]|nr:aldo/keto reductase [Alphaproteobacteria bacterium]